MNGCVLPLQFDREPGGTTLRPVRTSSDNEHESGDEDSNSLSLKGTKTELWALTGTLVFDLRTSCRRRWGIRTHLYSDVELICYLIVS